MKNSVQIAYEGLLTALSVMLLWLAAAVPAIGLSGCVCAGVLPAVMLSKRRVKAGAVIYASTVFLAFVLLPIKKYAVAYALFFGVYPFVKYAIERRNNLPLEWLCKFVYAICVLVIVYLFVKFGFFVIGGRLADKPAFIIAALFLAAFVFYDIVFSKIIALFNTLFRYVK